MGAAALLLLLLAGCAATIEDARSQRSGPLQAAQVTGARVALLVHDAPQPSLSLPGADCMLCVPSVTDAHAPLAAAVARWPAASLDDATVRIARALSAQGARVHRVHAGPRAAGLPRAPNFGPGIAEADYTVLREPLDADLLLVIEPQVAGIVRPHIGFASVGPPYAQVQLDALIVGLADNRVQWRRQFTLRCAPAAAWNEPPSFEALAQAYLQAVEASRGALVAAFESVAPPWSLAPTMVSTARTPVAPCPASVPAAAARPSIAPP